MSQALSVRCQNCGSPLQVGERIRFITCAYCHSELQVVRDASTVHTEVLQRIEQNTEATVNQLKVIEIQNEIERLDREWDMWKNANLSRRHDGSLVVPAKPADNRTIAGAVIFALVIGGAFIVLNEGGPGAWGMLAVGGLAILLFARHSNEVARSYLKSRQRYQSARDAFLIALDRARGSSRN